MSNKNQNLAYIKLKNFKLLNNLCLYIYSFHLNIVNILELIWDVKPFYSLERIQYNFS